MTVTTNSLNESENNRFFLKTDWACFWLTFAISLLVYTLTLAPTVTLEDSGELIVASDYLGVPHPPGYPIWTVLTWLFQWIFHGVKYHGHPNPAWGVNFFSAFTGAIGCGAVAMLISSSGRALLEAFTFCKKNLAEKTREHFAGYAGFSAGLLFAFTQCMWSQSVIAEVYSMNIMFQSLVLLLLYQWTRQPGKMNPLYAMAFLFGLGCTNHQTLMFMGPAMALAILFIDRKLFRDFAVVGILLLLMVGAQKLLANTPNNPWLWVAGPSKPGFWAWTVYALAIPLLGLFLPNGKKVCITILLVFLGAAFYGYMPIASEQNPPMNWGYARSWEGFTHAITRGQYERVILADVFSPRFLKQIGIFWLDLRAQFYWPIAVLAAIPLFFMPKLKKRENLWILTTIMAFIGVSIVFLVLQNPKMDIQSRFIARVQYIQSHAIYSIWIGYGILLFMGSLESIVKNNKLTKIAGVTLVAILPLALIYKNYHDAEQIRITGGSEMNGHDFGWQFGNWQLQGAEGIKTDLQAKHGDEFEKIWAQYPDPTWPPPMDTNAVFFGGTDPGRFVPTYMIYSAKVRPDIYLITQNALADRTYMNTMRDMYGDQIWIPTIQDSDRAFREYVTAVQTGKIQADADIQIKNGKVNVQGVGGVMKINALLSKEIFDRNQFITEPKTDEKTRPAAAAVVPEDPPAGMPKTRAFYIEESYPMPWMYPYLTPHGLIMKLNNEPTPLTKELIAKDRAFWNWYTAYLMSDEKFIRDITARKTFSKLRNSIAGMYQTRGRLKEAEYAYKQAIELYDLSPECNYRLATLLQKRGRYDEAIELIQSLYNKDSLNQQVKIFLDRLKKEKGLSEQLKQLEVRQAKGEKVPAMQRFSLYVQLGRIQQATHLANQILKEPKPNPQNLLNLAMFFERQRNLNGTADALRKILEQQPNNADVRVMLAAIFSRMGRTAECMDELRQIVATGGEQWKLKLQQDQRLARLRKLPEFKNLTRIAPSTLAPFMK
ncbi:protein O-mannosyl-transferase family [Verrucomicrobiota bacterium]